MRTHLEAKAMATALRQALAGRQVDVSHSEALEIVANQFGLHDWNTLAARIADDPAGSQSVPPDPNPSPITFSAPVPILRIFSVERAMEFYLGFLGFTLHWEHRFGENFPLYAQVSRGGFRLQLSEHHGDGTPGSATFIPMTGIDAFHRELLGCDYPYAKPGISDEPWGRGVEVIDPFGNHLRFCQQPA